MPANQQILKPRQEVDMEITVTDGDVMPYTYHLHDVFSETVERINFCKRKGIMLGFRAIYDFDTDTPTTGMVAIDPKMIISVCEEPKAVKR